jgi:hypothetical protein
MRAAATVAGALAAAALLPAGAAALEPRYDHRDTHGPIVEVLASHDTVAIAGEATASAWRPALRLAWGVAATGEGDEIVVGVTGALARGLPQEARVLVALDARYRGYFGLDEWKTFFDAGLWLPLVEPIAVGPLVGLGVQWDPSRAFGVYGAASFATAFGEARIVSFTVSLGAQLRFE